MFSACGDDEDEVKTFSYTLYLDPRTYSWSGDESSLNQWMNSILNAYKAELGISSDTFSKTGTQSECDNKVIEDCKKAEATVKEIRGGVATVIVLNNTVNKTVYSYTLQP